MGQGQDPVGSGVLFYVEDLLATTPYNFCENLPADQRTRQGSFFTPKKWVDVTHRLIESTLGEKWRERYTVWDPCCGAGALTAGRDFSSLYLSTLEPAELEVALKFNPSAEGFIYDFLNDHSEDLPRGLLDCLITNRRLVIIMNPPYGKPPAGTRVGAAMEGMNKARTEMITMFMWRVTKLLDAAGFRGEVHVILISKNIYTSPIYASCVNDFLERFSPAGGFIFPSTEFQGTKGKWPVCVVHFVNARVPWNPDNELRLAVLE